MASIGSDTMIVRCERRADDSWLFTVSYTALFADTDLGEQFDDSVQIIETLPSGRVQICECPVAFRATGPRVFRKKRIVLRGVDHDPNLGWDTVWASVRLHHRATGVDDERCVPALVGSDRIVDAAR